MHLPMRPGNAGKKTDVLYFPMTKKTTLNEIGEMLAHVVKHMATKDDIADLRREIKGDILTVQTQVNSIGQQLRETKIEVRLGSLEEKVFGTPRR